jgi:NAD(P)-dependent dehydrogenase (short-subunit alcohol dehydrogenase family)
VRRLVDRVALVTGGGSGIGREIAVRLAREGAAVAVSGRRVEPLEETVSLIAAEGAEAVAVTGDVADDTEAERMVGETLNVFGRLDVLVPSAGILRRELPIHEVPLEVWEQLMAVNLRGVFLTVKAALNAMRPLSGDRSIVTIASTLAHGGAAGAGVYAATKAGIISLTRTVALENAREGIRANCVCPALVDTPMAYVDRPDYESNRAFYEDMYPLGRLGRADDVAGAVAYFASEDSRWVTGAVLNVDGGLGL